MSHAMHTQGQWGELDAVTSKENKHFFSLAKSFSTMISTPETSSRDMKSTI